MIYKDQNYLLNKILIEDFHKIMLKNLFKEIKLHLRRYMQLS
jgi:hypothetical protein